MTLLTETQLNEIEDRHKRWAEMKRPFVSTGQLEDSQTVLSLLAMIRERERLLDKCYFYFMRINLCSGIHHIFKIVDEALRELREIRKPTEKGKE